MDTRRILFCWLTLSSACVLPEVGEDSASASTAPQQPERSDSALPADSSARDTAMTPPSDSQASAMDASTAPPSPSGAQGGGGANPAASTSTTPPPAANTNGMTTAAMSGGAGTGSAAGSGSPGSAGARAMTMAPSTGAAGRPANPTMMPGASGRCGPANTNPPAALDQLGPWTPMHIDKTGPKSASWIYFPADLGKDGFKHPVFNWGPGSGNTPDQYADHLSLLASQGFVTISQASTDSGKEALDWILAENNKAGSMWFGKLDASRIGRGGHSMGALQTFNEADDPRLTLYVLVCGGSNGGEGAAKIHAPSILLGGEGEGATANFEGDYAAIQTAPSVFVTKTDTDHVYCARNNLAPWVAFMRLTWCGDEQYRADLKDGGTFCKSPWLNCKSKNGF